MICYHFAFPGFSPLFTGACFDTRTNLLRVPRIRPVLFWGIHHRWPDTEPSGRLARLFCFFCCCFYPIVISGHGKRQWMRSNVRPLVSSQYPFTHSLDDLISLRRYRGSICNFPPLSFY